MPERAAQRPAERTGAAARRATGRLGGAWRGLDRDRRLAGVAAVALAATLLLPWYQQTGIAGGRPVDQAVSAFGVFGFVEGAILLVSAAVLVLLFTRGEGRAFHLPGGDGAVICAAGAWAVVLLVWRLFDRPGPSGAADRDRVGLRLRLRRRRPAGLRRPAGPGRAPPRAAAAGGARPAPPRPVPPARPRSQRGEDQPPAPSPAPPAAPEPPTAPTRVLGDEHPTRVGRRREVPPVPDEQLTMPLGSEEPLPREERE